MAASSAIAADVVTKAPAQPPAQEKRWLLTFDTDIRYYAWERTAGNPADQPNAKGSQLYIPVGAQLIWAPTNVLKLEFIGRGGYVRTTRSTDPGLGIYMTGTASTMTDTVVGGTATYMGLTGIQPFYSVNLNLPTGQSVLNGPSAIARTDADLVEVPAFGVGFNVAQTLGTTIAFAQNLALTLSVGHTMRGDFDRDQIGPFNLLGFGPPPDRLSPGDALTGTASLAFGLGDFSGNVSVAYSGERPTGINGVQVFQSGESLLITGVGVYRWNEMWTSTAVASFAHADRLLLADPVTLVLLAEPQNSSTDMFRISFDQSAAWDRWQVNGVINYLRRNRNSYDPFDLAFAAAKTKIGVGSGVKYALTGNMLIAGKVEVFRVKVDENPGNFDPAMTYNGWMASIGTILRY